MNAIKLLKQQHREVKALFHQAEDATPAALRKLADEISDKLAVHAAIEEHHFYPAAMAEKTEDMLREAVEEHLGVKRIIADLLNDEPSDPQFRAKLSVLKEMVLHHVEEEEGSLFGKAEKVLGDDALETLGEQMQREVQRLTSEGAPREAVPEETEKPAPLPAPMQAEGKRGGKKSTEARF